MKKTCFRCKTQKSVKEFQKDRSSKDGFSSSCSGCRNFARRNKKLIEKVNGKIEKAKSTSCGYPSDEGPDYPEKTVAKKSGTTIENSGYVRHMTSLDGDGTLEIPAFPSEKIKESLQASLPRSNFTQATLSPEEYEDGEDEALMNIAPMPKNSIEITWEDQSQVKGITEMSRKFGVFWNMHGRGDNATLVIHTKPIGITIRGTPEEVIEKALAY